MKKSMWGRKKNDRKKKTERNNSVKDGVRILLKKGPETTSHIAAASHTEGLNRMLWSTSDAKAVENPYDCSKQKEEEMNSENASLTNTGNYTTSGMPQRCQMLEAIENWLAYCDFAVRKDIFTLAC